MVILSKRVGSVCHADLGTSAEVSNHVYDQQIEKKTTSRIVLASQSEHRKKAMAILGLSYECLPANIDEKAIRDSDPLKMALMISKAKALSLANIENGIIIAGDTFLVFEGKVLEKPISLDEAHAMLNILSGNQYTLVSGLAVYDTLTGKMRSTVATCDIHLRTISQEEITDYCNRYPVLKFAGAHETDGVVRFSEKIEGSCIIETTIPMKDLVIFLQEIEEERR